LRDYFGAKVTASILDRGELTLETTPDNLISVCESLCREQQFSYEQLTDLCGVDYSSYGQTDWTTQDATSSGFSRGVNKDVVSTDVKRFPTRFAVVYHLLSVTHNRRLRLRCFVPSELPRVSSVVDVWSSADWYEREAFDLFGIMFEGHPDLRRILTDYGFIGNPFRKNFPLEGNVEVRYDPEQKRVVYQPVSIESRTLVPRVIRDEHRSEHNEPEA